MYVATPGIQPRTSDLRVRCPTDCATRHGHRHQGEVTTIALSLLPFSEQNQLNNPYPLLQLLENSADTDQTALKEQSDLGLHVLCSLRHICLNIQG